MSTATSRSPSPEPASLSDTESRLLRMRALFPQNHQQLSQSNASELSPSLLKPLYGGDSQPLISLLPPEILAMVFSHVHSKTDLFSIVLSCKYWASIVIDTIWFRPGISNKRIFYQLVQVMKLDHRETHWDYKKFIKRLNLSLVPHYVNDDNLSLFSNSVNLERITLVNCSKVHHETICNLLLGCSKLQSIDLTGVKDIQDEIYLKLASECKRLQGLYAPGSQNVSGEAVLNLIQNCPQLKRIKLSDCNQITDSIIHELVINCPYLVELDLHGCEHITNDALNEILLNLESLKEFKLSRNNNIDWRCFETPTGAIMSLDKLRILDFTQCMNITDKAVEKFILLAPKLRNVVLSKCSQITDQSLKAIATLGKNLHYIHLGHCSNITDEGAKILIRSCYRLQYIDLACCNQLTNSTVMELASLPKLRRIGLVKCSQITDVGILALAENRNIEDSLERIHLSYCIHLTIFPIYKLLKSCPKLTHISLTGISQFLRPDITRYCREPPSEFNQHQKSIFCVFSGDGVNLLRRHLAELIETTQEEDREALELAQIIRGVSEVVQAPPTYDILQNSASRNRFVAFSRTARDFLNDYNLESVQIDDEQIELFLRCVFGGIPTSHTPIIQRFFQLMHDRPAQERRRQRLRSEQQQQQQQQQQQVVNGTNGTIISTTINMNSNNTTNRNNNVLSSPSQMGGENNFVTPTQLIEMINATNGIDFSRRLINLARQVEIDIENRMRPIGFTDGLFSYLVMRSTMPNGQINQIELSRQVMQANLFLRLSAHFNSDDPNYVAPSLVPSSITGVTNSAGNSGSDNSGIDADGDVEMN